MEPLSVNDLSRFMGVPSNGNRIRRNSVFRIVKLPAETIDGYEESNDLLLEKNRKMSSFEELHNQSNNEQCSTMSSSSEIQLESHKSRQEAVSKTVVVVNNDKVVDQLYERT